MNQFFKIFFSIGFACVMFIVFAFACALATIIETVFNTDAAWAYVYGTSWFGLIMVILGINLAYNLYRYNMARAKKLPSFLFHFGFIFILLGAVITRYFGFEGSMHIRENEQSNVVSSREVYMQLISTNEKGDKISTDLNQYVSTKGKNKFDMKLEIDGKTATLSYKKFILNGIESYVNKEGGTPRAEILFSDGKNRRTIAFKNNDSVEIGDVSFTFNEVPKQSKFISIILKDGKFYLKTNQQIYAVKMSDSSKTLLPLNTDVEMGELSFYNYEGLNFSAVSLLSSAVKGIKEVNQKNGGNNVIIANLNYNGEDKEVYMLFGENPRNFSVGGKNFELAWAPKLFHLPFYLKLKDFKLDRYPGSNSPSGYSSEISVISENENFDYEIFMNHVLDYAGYRFFQNSYDIDEMGTILSVNRDPGKMPTYLGYILLCLGMFLNFFNPNSRFTKLSRLINNAKISSFALIFCALFATNAISSELPKIDENHAKNLGSLIVQGFDGRMEPFDTAARDLLNKIHRSDSFVDGMSPNATMLSMMIHPEYWEQAEVIKVDNDELKKILGMDKSRKYAKIGDFYNENREYKLQKLSEEINRRPPGNRSQLDKEILKVDERLNIFYNILMTEMFRFIPKQNGENNEWFSPVKAMIYFDKNESEHVSKVLSGYFTSVLMAEKDGDWKKADLALEKLKEYQQKVGADVMPSKNVVNFELFFNKAKIFERLMPVYLITGLILLALVFTRLMKPGLQISKVFEAVYTVNILAFIIHTIGLAIRWYISGHAPWSNAYESLVYIAWALSLSGIIFSKTSALSLALTSILAGITLFVAHLSMMDPQVGTIMPVLKSYWLTIHVSVITASYGFLGLCWLLGIFTLLLFIIQSKKPNDQIINAINEATHINEMSMIFGLSLLTVGNFLGGVWANESWGRYWGWDPKETWALITILVYAAVLHFRFIPRLNSQIAFAIASAFAYSSVIMTYFGVNFYLTGMHSYASGEKVPVPTSIWVIGLTIIVLSILAFRKRRFSGRL